jgi:amicyanin
MKKTSIIALIAIIVVGGVVAFALTRSKDTSTGSESTADTVNQQAQTSTTQQPDTPTSNDDNQSADEEVEIEDFAFSPATITVKKGTTVTWTNRDSVSHTVTPDQETDAFKGSELLGKDESYSFTFNVAGTYSYFCKPHPQMKAKVVVTE